MKLNVSALAAFTLLFPLSSLLAHHGTAGSYDLNKVVKLQGVVKEFRWRNPHSALFVVGKDGSGAEVIYSLEMGSPITLVRFGYTRNTFKPGDELVIQIHPSLTNPTSGVTLSSQKVIVNGKEMKSGLQAQE